MALHTKEVTINEKVYIITPFTGRKGLAIQAKLFSLIIPALGSSIKSLKSTKDIGDLDMDLEKAALFLAERMDDETVSNLVMKLVSSATCEGEMVIDPNKEGGDFFDREFAANFGDLFKLVWEILNINFGSFLGEGGFGKLLKKL